MNNVFYIKLVRLLSIILVITGLFFAVKYTIGYMYPFLIALLIASFLHPLVTKIEVSWKFNRTIATFFVILSFFTLFFVISFLILKRLLKESTSLVETLPEQFNQMKLLLAEIGQSYLLPAYEKLTEKITLLPSYEELEFNNYLLYFIDEIGASSSFFLKNIVSSTSAILSSITYAGTIFIFISLAVFMMTKDLNQIKTVIQNLIPAKFISKGRQIIAHLKSSVFGFIKAQIAITMISSFIVMTGLLIFQIDNVLIITLTMLLVDFIPYVGIGAVFIPWIIYTFFIEQYALTIQLAGLYIVVIIVRQIIEPRILASSIGIHPLITLIILFIGIQSLGIFGIFITPIILIILSAIYHAGIIHYLWNFIKNG
ncbi:sporulation integral membrane protein YtvI [Pseudogracilibacillus sp. SE30717A]|uniref:sporulation integral membrane protein YtvI n=1 Tax=Pseudogracilibacillus sp. SE30717A TaxID=3098293 RepID=UPI00300DC9D4